jgi:tyrosine-protein kinase Etk/Wzc
MTDNTGTTAVTNVRDNAGADNVSLLDVLIVLAKHKAAICFLVLVAAVASGIYAFSLPDVYTASTKLLPPQQAQSPVSALLSTITNLTNLGGGGKSVNDVYIAMLKSRTINDQLVKRGLIRENSDDGPPETVKITSGRDGLISIDVTGTEPGRAAALANGHVEELVKFTQVLAVTEASQRRLFFERQYAQAKDNLARVEVTARQALEGGGLVNVDNQARVMITAISTLRAQITAKDVQIGAMRTFAGEHHPELQRAREELESMKRELAKIEGTSGASAGSPKGAGQSKGIENVRLMRELKYSETLYELLARQYELAKMDEARDASVIQVMDAAVEPKKPSGPKRGQLIMLAVLAALIVGVLWAVVREAVAGADGDSQQSQRLRTLRQHLRWR